MTQTEAVVRSTSARSALKLALEALEGFYEYGYDRRECFEHITAIKEALSSPNGEAQPEPSPEWMTEEEQTAYTFGWFKALEAQRTAAEGEDTRRAWVGLTDEQIAKEVEAELTHYWNGEYIDTTGARDQLKAFARAIEAKLRERSRFKEKNTRNGGCL